MKKFIKKYGKKIMSMMAVAAVAFTTVVGTTGCGAGTSSANTQSGKTSSSDSVDNGASDAGSGDLTTLRFGVMTGNIDHLITAIGTEKGFFEKNGIDLKVTEYAAGINTVDALTMDQLDVGIAADFAILNRIGNAAGSDLKITANYANAGGAQLYVNPETVKDKNDLKGKRIINLPGVIYEYWNVLTAQKLGLGEGDYTFVNVDSQPSAVVVASQGDGDAFWAGGEVAAQLAGYGWTPIMSLDDIGATTTLFFIAREAYAKNNAETLKKFYAGFSEAIDYISTNLDDAAKIVAAKAGLSEDKFKQLVSAYDLGIQFKKSTFDYLDGVNKWLKDNSYYKTPYETKDILFLDAAREAYSDKFEI
ncbi:MAG TPA: hypothetical protein DCP06_07065 [Lachnospiraceae bacterium]|nr:hypothetical protein [Lachnospiraceae bacterium]